MSTKCVDITVQNMVEDVPEKGWYLTLNWGYIGDDERHVEYGPIPEKRKDMLLEIINLLNDMIDKYADTDIYEAYSFNDLSNFDKYFDYKLNGVIEGTEEYRVIYDIGLCAEYDYYDEPMKLVDYNVVWHDGKVLNSYNTNLIYES